MNLSAISHRCAYTDCYAYNEDILEVNIKTALDVDSVTLVWHDPYSFRKQEKGVWSGGRVSMNKKFVLKRNIIWNCSIEPPFKRAEYYFEVHGKAENGEETVLVFENDFASPQEFENLSYAFHKFKMAWMNPADIVKVPEWVKSTIWYQIMPDRFCSAGNHPKKYKTRPDWNDDTDFKWNDFFGGDLQGVTSKLDYLKELGINGIYFTPVFKSNSNHKYNIEDYAQIDPDFGTEEDMKTLVTEAHKRGIRIMLDAVFNHTGLEFPFWEDLVKNGEKSKYKDWFFVNKFPVTVGNSDTSDGRYFSFDFVRAMPKLNTNNPEVQKYFLEICSRWVKDWNVDGIRFDVGNEVSHDFMKVLHRGLLEIKKDLFLLGEIWTDSVQWLAGDEYHSVMNYPFMNAVAQFFNKGDNLESAFSYVYSLYYRQVNEVLFNFIDTHDTDRAFSNCKNLNEFYQNLVVLMTMQGTPCIFYGTEAALDGREGPYNRRPMPWKKIENGDFDQIINTVKQIIKIRRENPSVLGEKTEFVHSSDVRQVHYVRFADDGKQKVHVRMNASESDMQAEISSSEKLLFQNGLKAELLGKILLPAGAVLVTKESVL